VDPSGMARGLEDVLILVEGVHQAIPDAPPASQPVFIGTPPPADAVKPPDNPANAPPRPPRGLKPTSCAPSTSTSAMRRATSSEKERRVRSRRIST
jgi:hypothetical protein